MRKVNGTIVLMLLLSSLMLTLPVLQLTPNVQAQGGLKTLHSEKPLTPIHMHSLIGFIDPYNPLQTPFHELYPQYCQEFALTSWEDVNQTGHLNGGDQIDMINLTGGEVHWFYVDRVTYTLRVKLNPEDPQSPEMYIEYKGTYDNETLRYNPICSYWHEVYPVYGPLFHIKNYQDTGQPIGLSFCDWVQFDDNVWWHIEDAATDLILNEKIADPTGTYWNELHPVFGNRYHITQWTDADGLGLLSPGDKVTLDPGQVGPSSVTQVTLTLNITLQGDPSQRMYLEFTGGYPHMWEPKTNPIGSMWHEVYPVYCPMYEIIGWVDNCNGVLSYCDFITLFDLTSQQPATWHVEELAVDMIVQEPAPPVHDVAVISVTPLFGSVFQGWPDPITVDVQNQGDFTETFTVSVYYGTNPVTTSPITVTNLAPSAIQTLKFCWVTTNVPPNTYTITVEASIVPGETDTADNTLPDGSVTILARPPFYWKDGFCDYAPSGMPDFDQRQDNWNDSTGKWSYCGPTAAANSLWWLDSKFEPAQPPMSPPTPSDGFPLVSSYIPGIDDHDSGNVQPFIQHLAYLMDTDGQRTMLVHSGTNVKDMEAGLAQYLSWTGVNPKGNVNGDGIVNQTDVDIVNAAMGSTPISGNWNMAADIAPVTVGWPNRQPANNKVDAADLALVTANLGTTDFFYEHTVDKPDFYYIEQEVEKSQDVVLLLGYWILITPPQGTPYWFREDGHYATVAGVNSQEKKIAISDPCHNAFEDALIQEGRVPIPHAHLPPQPPYVTHNDAAYVSHDIYNVERISLIAPNPPFPPCPGGNWTLMNYVGWNPTPPYFTVIESAVITSPLGIHDINVTDVATSKDGCTPMPTVGQSLTMRINVTVKNEGDFTESFTLTVNATNATTSIVVGTQTVNDLLSGQTRTATFTWDTSGFAKDNYTISAYAWPVPGETDTADNTFIDGWVYVGIPGDINVDGFVELMDFYCASSAFGSKPGDPNWNPNADINDDEFVELMDFFIISQHFGEHN